MHIENIGKLLSHATLYTAAAILLKVSGFLLFMWFAYSLPVKEYAEFGVLYAVQSGLAAISGAGVVEIVIGQSKEHQNAKDRAQLYAAANATFTLTLIPATAFVLLFLIFTSSGTSMSMPILSTVFGGAVLIAYSTLQGQLIRLQEQHLKSLYFSLLIPLVGFLAGGAYFLAEKTIGAYFLGSIIGMLTGVLVLRASRIGFFQTEYKINAIRPFINRLTPFLVIVLLSWVSGYGNTILIEAALTTNDVARFTFLFTISSIMQLIATALNQAWNPRFFRNIISNTSHEVEKENRRFYLLQGLVLGVIGGLGTGCYSTITGTVGGNLLSYQYDVLELSLLASSYIALIPWWHCQSYFLAHDKGSELMKIMIASSIMGIILWMLLMWGFGSLGIYLGLLAHMMIRSVIIVLYSRRTWKLAISWEGVGLGMVCVLLGYQFSN